MNFGVEVSRDRKNAELMRDGHDAVFCSPDAILLKNYFDTYFAAEKSVKYDIVDISQYQGKTHDLTSVLASADIA